MAYRWNPTASLMRYKIPNVMAQILAMTEQATRKIEKTSPLWLEIERQVKLRDNWTCQKCGTSRHLDVYHIVPIEKGGSNMPFNLRTYCKGCYKEIIRAVVTNKKNPFAERGIK